MFFEEKRQQLLLTLTNTFWLKTSGSSGVSEQLNSPHSYLTTYLWCLDGVSMLWTFQYVTLTHYCFAFLDTTIIPHCTDTGNVCGRTKATWLELTCVLINAIACFCVNNEGIPLGLAVAWCTSFQRHLAMLCQTFAGRERCQLSHIPRSAIWSEESFRTSVVQEILILFVLYLIAGPKAAC